MFSKKAENYLDQKGFKLFRLWTVECMRKITSKKIELGGKKFLVIDLSEPLRLDVEVFPGDPRPQKKVFSDIFKTGFQHHIYALGDHVFHPHGDAPNHQNKDLIQHGFDFFGLDYFFNSACLIDLSHHANAKKVNGIKYVLEVTLAHLKPFEYLLKQKTAVLIRTGYDKWLETNRPHQAAQIPYLSKRAAQFLADFKNINVVGIDSLTVDAAGTSRLIHDSHRVLRKKLIVESLVHLHVIPKTAHKNFDLQTAPIRIQGATGGPIAAFAFIRQ